MVNLSVFHFSVRSTIKAPLVYVNCGQNQSRETRKGGQIQLLQKVKSAVNRHK